MAYPTIFPIQVPIARLEFNVFKPEECNDLQLTSRRVDSVLKISMFIFSGFVCNFFEDLEPTSSIYGAADFKWIGKQTSKFYVKITESFIVEALVYWSRGHGCWVEFQGSKLTKLKYYK